MENTNVKLKELMQRKGLTQGDIANLANVTQAAVSYWVNGLSECPDPLLDLIATRYPDKEAGDAEGKRKSKKKKLIYRLLNNQDPKCCVRWIVHHYQGSLWEVPQPLPPAQFKATDAEDRKKLLPYPGLVHVYDGATGKWGTMYMWTTEYWQPGPLLLSPPPPGDEHAELADGVVQAMK